jgi:hypothetical protein
MRNILLAITVAMLPATIAMAEPTRGQKPRGFSQAASVEGGWRQ